MSIGEGHFDLYLPLQRPFEIALSLPAYNDAAYKTAIDSLENYFITFPTQLMNLDGLIVPWQFEAMLWFHGIHILLNSGPDFLELLMDSTFLASPGMTSATDHAILLGDILEAMNTKRFVFVEVCHATIFFIALSATVHIALLRQMLLEGRLIPLIFRQSLLIHQIALSLVLELNSTCNHSLIRTIRELLTYFIQLLDGSASASDPSEDTAFSVLVNDLSFYRWVPTGRGLIPLDPHTASQLLRVTMNKYSVDQTTSPLSCNILTIMDPDSRINQLNTFDLSILF
jgi:hypothetical protein